MIYTAVVSGLRRNSVCKQKDGQQVVHHRWHVIRGIRSNDMPLQLVLSLLSPAHGMPLHCCGVWHTVDDSRSRSSCDQNDPQRHGHPQQACITWPSHLRCCKVVTEIDTAQKDRKQHAAALS